jgi:hypothetical protein
MNEQARPAGSSALARARDLSLRALAAPRAIWIAALAAALVALPSLGAGLAADDHMTRAGALRAPAGSWASLDLFGEPNLPPHRAFIVTRDLGRVAWYARDDFQVSFLRPLASLGHWLDWHLFPRAQWAMHAHSVAWYALAAAVIALLLRRTASTPLAGGLGALIFALDPSHVITVSWLANRNALLALALGGLALVAYDRRARPADGERARVRDALLGPLAYLASLLSAEIGVSTLAYLAAHALCLDRAPRGARAWRLVPYLAVTLIWRLGWTALGRGARGSSLYLDPLSAPVAYARATLTRAPLLLASALGGPRTDWVAYVPTRTIALGAALSAVALVAFVVVARRLLRASPAARFFALGAALAVVPVCGVQANDRNLAFVGIGAAGLLAELACGALGLGRARLGGRALAALGGTSLAVRLALFGATFPLEAAWLTKQLPRVELATTDGLLEAAGDARAIVVLRAADMFTCTGSVGFATARGLLRDRVVLCLSGGPTAATVRTVDDHTLIVRPEGGFLDAGSNRLHWDGHAVRVGETFQRPGWTAEVLEVDDDAEPRAIAFHFAPRLSDPAGAWLVWRRDHYERLTLPKAGQSIRIVGGEIRGE